MNLDVGTIVIFGAVLVFYLKLVINQRRAAQHTNEPRKKVAGRKKGSRKHSTPPPRFGSLSDRKRDWVIAAAGFALVVIGILFRNGVLGTEQTQSSWWLPVAVGIIAFSFWFK